MAAEQARQIAVSHLVKSPSLSPSYPIQRAPPDFQIQSCFMKAKLWLNDYMVNLLKEPTDWTNSSQTTAFDCWLYNQLFATSHTYTTL